MRSVRIVIVCLAVVALVASCSSSDDSDSEGEGSTETTAPAGGDTAPAGTDDTIVGDAAIAAEDQAAVDQARTFLETESGVDPVIVEQLLVADVQTSGSVKHVRFDQVYGGYPVHGGGIVVHVLDDEIQGTSDDLSSAQPADVEATVEQAAAIDSATKAVDGEVVSAEATQVWVEDAGELRLSWLVTIQTANPSGDWTVVVDASDGTVTSTEVVDPEGHRTSGKGDVATAPAAAEPDATTEDACEVPEAPSACVFPGDPIYGSAGELDEENEYPNANDFLVGVELQGLDDPTSGRLVGEFADTESEFADGEPVVEADGTWATGRGEPGFEAAMAYYWIDYGQRLIQEVGFDDVRNEAFPIVPLDTDPDNVDNAYYSGTIETIFLGSGSNGINEGEDAAGILHEYGHAVLDDQNPDLFSGDEAGAYHEGFGDVFAFLTLLEYRTGTGPFDQGCLFAWTEEFFCLRRVDEDLVYPDDREFEVHQDGRIWAGAIFDVMDTLVQAAGLDSIADCAGATDDVLATCDEVRDRVLATNLAANYYLTSGMTLPDAAEAFLLANDASLEGADDEALRAVFAEHGLAEGGSVINPGDGPNSVDGDGVSASVDIEHSYRGDLDIDLSVVNDVGDTLCEMSLYESDVDDAGDNFQAVVGLADSECAEFVPPAPDQQWVLTVVDGLPEDEGTILDFTVLANDTEYRADNVPLPIPDDSSTGAAAIVTGQGAAGPDEPPDDGPVAGAPFISYAVTHPYVGDLQANAEVVDADGEILCSVLVLEPDPSNSSVDAEGEVDMSECADYLPPSPDQTWLVLVRDTAEVDEGTVDSLVLDDGTGTTYELEGVPVDIPDADMSGVRLVFPGGVDTEEPAGDGGTTMHVEITHPYQGDLSVEAGVIDADGFVRCDELGITPDAENSIADLILDIDMSSCERRFGADPETRWFIKVTDTLDEDLGEITVATLTLPSGAELVPTDPLPVEIPDADLGGVRLVFEPPPVTA